MSPTTGQMRRNSWATRRGNLEAAQAVVPDIEVEGLLFGNWEDSEFMREWRSNPEPLPHPAN